MVVMNTSKEDKKISLDKYPERTNGFTKYTDVVSKNVSEFKDFIVGSYKTVVLELNK